ncbi:MAG: Trk system potassium transporter TrkA [Spirochaetota bacterium]|nr:Trk system potassium transporter TrkA [Spirochaetota bacterium]
MKIVIVGAGEVGFQIAEQLIAENKDVVIIEQDSERVKYASNHLDCIVLQAEGNNIEILKEAGISKADYFISVTNSDEVNMIACGLVSSEFERPYKIARVRNLDYSRAKIFEKSFLGIDCIVNPEVEAAKVIANTVEYGASSDIMLFEKTDIQMRNIFIDEHSQLKNRALKDIKKSLKEDFLIGCISRQENIIIPSGKTIIRENDNVYLFATKKKLEEVFAKVGRSKTEIKNVIIVGGGRIGKYVAAYLIKQKRNVKIIDSNTRNCIELAEDFPEALVINGDISDEDIFEDEQLHSYDLIITTTNNQELNILAAIYAKTLGIKRAIPIVTKTNYLTIASNLGIDATISPKNSSVDTILKVIRKGNIKTIHSIFGGKAEVIEFSLENSSFENGKAIKELKIPENTLIVSVSRGRDNYIPGGDFVIQNGDDIIIITPQESISKVEDIFTSHQ